MPELKPNDWPSRRPKLRGVGGGFEAADLARIMAGVGEVAFIYDAESETFTFDGHAVDLLCAAHLSDIYTQPAFLLRIEPSYREVRRNAAAPPPLADLENAGYTVSYPFHGTSADTDGPIYVEEQARWSVRPDGTLFARGVMRVINERFLEADRLRDRSRHDQLTGLLNRASFIEVLTSGLDATRANDSSSALLMASVSGLGTINETFGIEAGDEVLITVAQLLRRSLRRHDIVGRYGSNKFAILLRDVGPGMMRVVADRLMEAVSSATIETSTSKLSTSLTVGAVTLPQHAQTAQAALTAALKALDRARGKRADAYVAYEPRPQEENVKRRNAMLANAIISALDDRRMSIELQPMVAARSGEPDHYECLLRMTREDGGVISAGEFMPIAEQLGMARLLDLRAQELTIDLLKQYPDVHLSLNVSGLTAADNEWLVSLHRVAQGKRQILERLTVEITETAAIQDLDQTIVFVQTIRELGCKVAIDDFGVGYTNFRNLKALNADLVKIDGAFVRNVCHDRGDQVFVRAMVELARTFGMQTVAEWVGDAETAAFLTEAGIDFLQGYHFGAPEAAVKLLGPPPAPVPAAVKPAATG